MEYANGSPMGIPKDSIEQEKAIEEWSEGNRHLANAIRSCIQNGIETFASCAGHGGINNDPYLSMIITDQNREKILNLMNQMHQNIKKVRSIDLSCGVFGKYPNQEVLSVHLNPKNKDAMFDLISESVSQSLPLESCSSLVQEMMKIEEIVHHEIPHNHTFGIYHRGAVLSYNIYSGTDHIFDHLYEEHNIKNGMRGRGMRSFREKKIVERMQEVRKEFQRLFTPEKGVSDFVNEMNKELKKDGSLRIDDHHFSSKNKEKSLERDLER